MDRAQAGPVVVDRALRRRGRVAADVHAQHAVVVRRPDTRDQRLDARVVEAEAVEQAALLGQTEQPRPFVAGLGDRGDRPHLDEPETERGEAVDAGAVLVQAGGEADRIRQPQPHDLDRRLGHAITEAATRDRPAAAERRQREMVGALGLEVEQCGAKQRVHSASPADAVVVACEVPGRRRAARPKPAPGLR